MPQNFMRFSYVKVIRTGKIYEFYQYERPFFYNFEKRQSFVKIVENVLLDRQVGSIRRAQGQVRRLINANAFEYGFMPIFVTYTFRKNIQNVKEANKLLGIHLRAIKRRLGRKLRYLVVPELQKRGAIHFHIVFFDLPYIEGIKKIFEKKWIHGFLQVKAVKHIRNIGAYISKYFAKQWFIHKGKNEKLYFCSMNLIKPIIFYTLDKIPPFDMMVLERSEKYVSEKYGIIKFNQYREK